MTYKEKFVVEVKYKGKILRVRNDTVYLPFGSEYSLYLKNLNSRRASVKISIDGQDVLDNSSLIIDPNTSVDLEGFLTGNQAKNKFKFIHKTKQIQDYRGDKIDDGIVRVEFAFEKDIIDKTIIHEHHYHSPFHWNYNNWFDGSSVKRYGSDGDGLLRGMSSDPVATYHYTTSDAKFSSNIDSITTSNSLGVEDISQPLDDEGITVKGSEINQQFRYAEIGELDKSEVIVINLKGVTEQHTQAIKKALTVERKLKCSTCGKHSRSSFKFCPNCGTFLE